MKEEKKPIVVPGVVLDPKDPSLTADESKSLSSILDGFSKLTFIVVDGLEYAVTPLEAAMLKKIARSEYTPSNGAEPKSAQDTDTWADVIMETPQDKGVFASLLKKEYVLHWDYSTPQDRSKRENICRLSDLGFKIYRHLNPLSDGD